MHFFDWVGTGATYLVSILTFNPLRDSGGVYQAPLLPSSVPRIQEPYQGPIFKPPTGRLKGPGSDFICDYTLMGPNWSSCFERNQLCWLNNIMTGERYDIGTNYESNLTTPIGVTRNYVLNITDQSINADGLIFPEAKIFNEMYPGPWIQACWGDTVNITVNNQLESNGTGIHWHGIRQWRTMHMDGVNGVTQCPTAPGDSFTYTWRAMQYGSSWYHSHYLVQYADGAIGPMTLHGPTSANYDEAKLPILMADWGHNSAFEAEWSRLTLPSILLNGKGNVTRYNKNAPASALPNVPPPYTLTFDPPPPKPNKAKRYLLRLINTSFESTFIFSIDNHRLQVISADFVPMVPYTVTSVLVGIGQRYNVIVEADPDASEEPLDPNGNYWIRTWQAPCFKNRTDIQLNGYERTGILRYGSAEVDPTTTAWPDINLKSCAEEPYASLQPILPWAVGQAANNMSSQPGESGQNLTLHTGGDFPDVNTYPLAFFSLGGDNFVPL